MYTKFDTYIQRDDGVCIPLDPLNRDYQEAMAWAATEGNQFLQPVATKQDIVAAIQAVMDGEARKRGYDDLRNAISYRGDPNPRFATEAEAYFLWRSAVWTKAYAVLATGAIPTIPEAIALMPPLELPEIQS
jgi:hypothetical protein